MFSLGVMKGTGYSISCTMNDDPKHLEFSEITDVVASVHLIAMLAERVAQEPIFWKWVVLAAYSGLQGAMVCNLGGTSTLGALDERSKSSMLEFLESKDQDNIKSPKHWLANFDALLKWAQDPARTPDGAIWKLTKEQRKSLDFLQHVRNEFTHFKAMSWSIEEGPMIRAVHVALEATERLMLRSPWVRRHAEGDELELLESSLAKARQTFG